MHSRLVYLSLLCGLLSAPASGKEPLSFNRDVRPILSDTCFFCHGPDEEHRYSGLRLDVEEEAKDWAIVPGDAEASEVISRIVTDDPDMKMPPPDSGKSLTREEIEILKRWVSEGAPYEPYWAYVPPKPSEAPQIDAAGKRWAEDVIDRYVYSTMQAKGLQPSPDADRATLIRRLTFDLTGLPPTPEAVRAFVTDPNPNAYAQLVDRLLASPAFGERMASYWLDLVRYADTVGYHGDQDHNISPYRDYIIDALNRDVPFDEFTRAQIAGDLLPDATTDTIVASGYNRLLQTSHEGGVQPKEYLAIYTADRIRNLSAVWMGATVGCAQCHDHKYDPYTIEDFYSMGAFFADVDEAQHFKVGTNSLPTRRPPEIDVLSRWQRERLEDVQSEIASLEKQLDELKEETPKAEEIQQRLEALKGEQEQWEASRRRTMVSQAIEPREMRVLPRGNWLDESGEIVEPSVPQFMPTLSVGDRRANRLDLANWLVDPEQGVGGLTARVMVNRFWYLLFGRGLSSSLADFGGQGEPPTHPELLDRLALDFIENGWSTKEMMRRLVMTRSYRQSSIASKDQLQADPENLWFARQSRYRVPAEMVRDNALAISGLLVRRVGGPSVKPYQPTGYYRHLNFPRRVYTPSQDSGQYRRGVYVHWQRQFLHPMLKALDAPSREECTAERPRSNTPLEALVLLNDPSMIDAAIALASQSLHQADMSTSERLGYAFERALSRQPDQYEMQSLQQLLKEEREHFGKNPEQASALLDSGGDDIDRSSASPAELAAWTSVARTLLNLYETVARY